MVSYPVPNCHEKTYLAYVGAAAASGAEVTMGAVDGVCVAVTGQMVVLTATVTVLRTMLSAGQLLTVDAQLVTLTSDVVYTIEVV